MEHVSHTSCALNRRREQAAEIEPTAMAASILKRWKLSTASMFVGNVIEEKARIVVVLGKTGSTNRKRRAKAELQYWQRVYSQLLMQHNETIRPMPSLISCNGKLKKVSTKRSSTK